MNKLFLDAASAYALNNAKYMPVWTTFADFLVWIWTTKNFAHDLLLV